MGGISENSCDKEKSVPKKTNTEKTFKKTEIKGPDARHRGSHLQARIRTGDTMRALLTSLLLVGSAAGEGMYVESYWESWVLKDWPTDYCAELKDVPATPVGSLEGVNYVNIGN